MIWNIVLDVGDFGHMMDWVHMNWWGFPFFSYWFIGVWFVQFIIALMVYRDAEKIGKNGLMWFVLVIIPWIGIFTLIAYIIMRNEEETTKEVMSDAQKVLDERYAKGEMTHREYIQAKEDIKKFNE